MPRNALFVAAAVATAAALAAACSSSDPASPPPPTAPLAAAVEAGAAANTFTPPSVTIARGGTVTWTFGARPHNLTFAAATGAPADSAGRITNAQVVRTFNTAGTFNYECTIHSGMTGTVVVQ